MKLIELGNIYYIYDLKFCILYFTFYDITNQNFYN